mmetsp:Transcript_16287/g.23576  ORF Transcript_16287/g.23576 Transcript_16287/m.23576 type:complete len:124 (-) Transcript_16287:13-384(-)
MAQDINAVAQQFVQYYYGLFQTNREGLRSLFTADSMLTFESEQFKGVDAIMEKFNSLTAGTIVHQVHTLDAQPSSTPGAILVLVSGTLQLDQDAPLKFSQVFHLNPSGASYFCYNVLFRLNLG